MTRIGITGAAGRMGRTLIEACHRAPGMELTAALYRPGSPSIGADAGEICGLGKLGVLISDDPAEVLARVDVLVDFTRPKAYMGYLDA